MATAATPSAAPRTRWIINPREEMEVLIKARYPLHYVVSWEEARVMNDLADIAARLGKRVSE